MILTKQEKKQKKDKKDKKPKTLKRGITSEWYYAIKWLAIICMVLDHTFKAINFGCSDDTLLMIKMIGRMAFPLFAWELVECFHFTKNRVKHLFMILALAIVSEAPYDRALKGTWCTWEWQNVCFTFLIGWLVIWSFNLDWEKLYWNLGLKGKGTRKIVPKFAPIACFYPLYLLANYACVDYIWHGIGLVFLFEFAYRRKHRKLFEFIAIAAYAGSMGVSISQIYLSCFFCLIPMWMSECAGTHTKSGEERQSTPVGKLLTSAPSKWICRTFYPAHLLVLAIISEVIAK